MNTRINLLPGMLAVCVSVALSGSDSARAGTHSAESNITTVDTRDATVTVSGRVLEAGSRTPLGGVTVTLAGQTRTTSGSGSYSFSNVSLSAGSTLTASRAGYRTQSMSVRAGVGEKQLIMSDVLLSRGAPAQVPEVLAVEPSLQGFFIAGVPLPTDFTARVDWNGLPPGSVRFYGNGRLIGTISGNAPRYTQRVEMDGQVFPPSFDPRANALTVQAQAGGGELSEAHAVHVTVIPLPAALKVFSGEPWSISREGHLGFDFHFPEPPHKAVLELPVIGKFGFEWGVNGSFDYTVSDGNWEVAFGVGAEKKVGKRGRRPTIPSLTRSPRMKLYLGNKEVTGKIEGGTRGTALPEEGIVFEEVFGRGSIEAKLELGRVGLLDLFGPGLSTSVSKIPGLGGLLKTVSIIIYVIPGIDGEMVFALKPRFEFRHVELSGKVGLEAAYEPDLGIAEMRLYVGGEPSLMVGWPGDFWKQFRFRGYAGAEFSAWLLTLGPFEYVWVDIQIPSDPRMLTSTEEGAGLTSDRVQRFNVINGYNQEWRPRSRAYRQTGPERFNAALSGRRGLATQDDTRLRAFRSLGRTPIRGSVGTREGKALRERGGVIPENPQADLLLIENAFPSSAPAMAALEDETMLLYVADNGDAAELRFTDIRWTRWDGENWSEPAPINADTRAEFAPQVAYDGNGDAVAVWERVADPKFSTVDLTAMAAEMEIVWSRWDRATGTWTEPAALTANQHLDYSPLLCGPMSNGNLLLIWTENQQNLLIGTNGAGADTVFWCEWEAASRSWSAPQPLLTGLAYRLSQSLAGMGEKAVYAWTVDPDGVLTNEVDQEVFYREYAKGQWGAVSQFTTNSVPDKNVRVAVGAATNGGPAGAEEGFESGDFSRYAWASGGNAPWTVQTAQKHSGTFAAASATISDSESSSLSLSIKGEDAYVQFAYKVSSESGYDYLRFLIDGVEQNRWSGEVEWTTAAYPVTAGEHTFEWRYTKDGSSSEGSDKAWIDDVVVPGAAGQPGYLVWQQDTNLVMSRDFAAPTEVRPDSVTAGFADYALSVGPLGHLVLLWQEVSEDGSDAHYRVFDPAADTWGKDDRLFQDSSLERSFAPVWDALDNLVVAYNKVEMLHTNKTVTLEGGGEITITNVPVSGRVDLMVTRRALVTELELAAGDFQVEGVNYLPGDPLALTATVRNTGNVAVRDAVVSFFDGDPDAGGTLMTNVTIEGWLEAAAAADVEAVWIVPEPAAPHTLYAAVDWADNVTEYDEANNTQSVGIGGTDLAVSLKSSQAETNGAVRVVAVVQNLGAPTAPASNLAIRVDGVEGEPLATVLVPELEPGRLAEVALDLPAGTQPEGEVIYRLVADEAGVANDVDLENNTTAFAVNLWVDTDADGIPDGFEQAHAFLSENDPEDAALDYDGDGLSNLAEYQAGTDLADVHSYLRIHSLAVGDEDAGVELRWGSVSGRLYTVWRSDTVSGGFVPVAEHIQSTPPENVWHDPEGGLPGARFYRLQVE